MKDVLGKTDRITLCLVMDRHLVEKIKLHCKTNKLNTSLFVEGHLKKQLLTNINNSK